MKEQLGIDAHTKEFSVVNEFGDVITHEVFNCADELLYNGDWILFTNPPLQSLQENFYHYRTYSAAYNRRTGECIVAGMQYVNKTDPTDILYVHRVLRYNLS